MLGRSSHARQRGNTYSSRARGGYKGSRGAFAHSAFSTREQGPDPIPVDLGDLITRIKRDDLRPTQSQDVLIRSVKSVASFNWLGKETEPMIAIPGCPPAWTPPRTNPQLAEDSGTYFRDLNAAYSPTHPLHATALAILASKAHIPDPASIDLVACASTLRSLFMFAQGERKTFRVMVEAVGDTVFFVRREGTPRETIPDVRGYGHSMPEAYTSWAYDVRDSVSNQRIIRYQLAGMDCLIRYEPDGYFPSLLGDGAKSTSGTEKSEHEQPFDLSDAMAGAAMTPGLPSQSASDSLGVRHAGFEVPQSATFELKTRSRHRKGEDFFADFAVRLWITQTPSLVVAFHSRGRFEDIEIRNVRNQTLAWEQDHQQTIKRFASLVRLIVTRARNESDGTIELWRHESGDLEIRDPGAAYLGSIPIDIEDQWGSVGSDDNSEALASGGGYNTL